MKDAILFIKEILKHRRFILLTTFIVTLISIIYVFVIPIMFTANVLVLPPSGSMGGFSQQILSLFSLGNKGTDFTVDIFADMLNSNVVIDSIINKYSLQKKWGTKTQILTRKRVRSRLSLNISPSQILSLKYTDTNPDTAAMIANDIVKYLDKIIRNIVLKDLLSQSQQINYMSEILKHSIDSLDTEIRKWQDKYHIVSVPTITSQITDQTIYNKFVEELMKYLEMKTDPSVSKILLKQQEEKVQSLKKGMLNGEYLLSDNPSYMNDYIKMRTEFKALNSAYQELSIQDINIKSQVNNFNSPVKVIQWATPPDMKSYPPRKFIVIGVFLFIILLDIFLIAIKYYIYKELPETTISDMKKDFINAIKDPFNIRG